MTDCHQCPVVALTAYSALAQRQPDAVCKLRHGVKTIAAKRPILRNGEVSPLTYTLSSGWAFRYMTLPDGRRQILSFYLPGNLIAEENLAGGPVHFSVRALTDVTLCVFQTEQLRQAFDRDSEMMRELLRRAQRRSVSLDHQIGYLGRTAQERVAHFLMDFEVRLMRRGLVQNDSFWFPLLQEHMADALGLTSVHVSRTLTAMREKGLFAIQDQTVRLLDRKRMLTLAGLKEDYIESRVGQGRRTTVPLPPQA